MLYKLVSGSRVTSFTLDTRGLLMRIKNDEGVVEERLILLIEPTACSDRELEEIGSAAGEDLLHCLYLAFRYERDFAKKVVAYSINNHPKYEKFKVRVTFYGKKRNSYPF